MKDFKNKWMKKKSKDNCKKLYNFFCNLFYNFSN